MAYHAGVPGISGGFVGVDFFFVLSGYLITGLLITERLRTGTRCAGSGHDELAVLLPASAFALIGTAIASIVLLPILDRPDVATDIVWAALFSANWRSAGQQTEYRAQDRSSSPALHFWSLGVEEQFYFVWPPLLLGLTVWWVRRRTLTEKALRRRLALAFAAVAAISFAWCVYETTVNQPYAFFGTGARAWQSAAGALLAVATPYLMVSARVRVIIGFLE